jgi:hypothetical protein
MIKECLTCSKEFTSKPSLKRKFCSLPCYRKAPVSEETKKLTASKLMGNRHTLGKRWNLSVETRKKMSEALKKAHIEGRHPTYKGGITSKNMSIRKSIESKLWREAVFQRDDFTCQECSIKGGKLNADHIKPFSIYKKLRFDVDNGRTLCVECHRKTDTYGWSAVHQMNQLINTYP